MPPRIRAIVFDLYDTLLRIREPVIHKEIPRLLGVGARPWMDLVRRLLTTAFSDRAHFVRFICESLSPAPSLDLEARCAEAVGRELGSVELVDGTRSLLAFLRRRGFTLGLVSNLTSVHKEPMARLGLEEHFAAMSFSCDQGVLKPDPRMYLELCARLGVEPESVLVVGNSLPNDILAPRALGMRALRVAKAVGDDVIPRLSDFGWLVIDPEPKRLVAEGAAVHIGGRRGVLCDLVPLSDPEQGRYNLVASARVRRTGTPVAGDESGFEAFCKRFLFPEAAYVEEFMHRLLAEIDMPSCDVFVAPGPEPVLVVSKAPGRRLEGPVDGPLAYELGRHCAAGYLFANADLRPRNAFVSYDGPRPVVTMVDLEHCLFNLALDVTGLEDPLRPDTFDRLPEAEVSRRVRRRVLTERTTRRAMRTFLELESLEDALAVAFRSGWVAAFKRVQSDRDRLCRRIEERVCAEPFLIIGTQAYRRAMARLDVEDIRSRIGQDPEAIFPSLAAVKARD